MLRLFAKIVLSFLLHIGWNLGIIYASMSEDFIDHPVFDYISNSIIGGHIVIFILGEITFILLILVYVIKPLEMKVSKIIFLCVSSAFTVVTFFFWYVQAIEFMFEGIYYP